MYETILIPTDGSAGAEAAIDRAIDLAETYGATLHAVYAVNPAAIPGELGATGVLDRLKAAGQEAVDAVIDRATEAGIDAEGDVVVGSPHRAILEYTDEHGVDLIVMGTHGRTGLDRVLIGSVTEKVVRTASVPVLTVPIRSATD